MKRNLIIATVTAAALLTGGTAAAFAASTDEDAPKGSQTATQVVTDDHDAESTLKAPKVTAEQALKSVAGHGTVVSLDLDDDDDTGRLNWDVELLTKDGKVQEWTVDATTAKAAQDRDDDQGQDDDRNEGQAQDQSEDQGQDD
ncbi:PepSY domain-containing protein [Streptomyces sp. NPDC045431]|uniref:PepSY domain-containing protein n=1 Tax=Streptomyces sp. NPDC045431 TaxID=3155613 RepID=UPI0034018F27